ncbi:hypothetical protein O0I10_007540 [Lichtheimia ornata]|uniref:Uncharacterized protein n=1 Tax=Lichtheimia ornata TaxID=688661 RepID=A0AAD7XXL0_9FUNG|nr:uncharacterized protein O0I10_007540 [Lichtheimia ornata]KAJ8656693.1 hypothetical protein O0I10_007540 [Lichtheimia ornata]
MGERVVNGVPFNYNKHARNLPMFQTSNPVQQVRSIAAALLLFRFDIVVLKLVCRLLFSRLQDLMEASRVFIPKLSTTTLLYTASFGSTCWMMVPVDSNKILISKQERCTLVQCSSSTYWIGWIQGYLQATMEWYWEHLKVTVKSGVLASCFLREGASRQYRYLGILCIVALFIAIIAGGKIHCSGMIWMAWRYGWHGDTALIWRKNAIEKHHKDQEGFCSARSRGHVKDAIVLRAVLGRPCCPYHLLWKHVLMVLWQDQFKYASSVRSCNMRIHGSGGVKVGW